MGRQPGADASWVQVDDKGTRRGSPRQGSLATAASDVGEREVIVLVPAEQVLTTVANIPIRSNTRLRAALPYALEDQLADDVDTLHFAAGNRYDNGQLPVAVVARVQMDEWLAELNAAGLDPAQMVPENHGLARIPGTLSMLIDADQIFYNDGDDTAFALQTEKPSDVLAVAGALDAAEGDDENEDEVDGSRHLVAYCEPADEARFEHDWNALRHELNSVDINLLPDGVLPRLAVTVAAGHGINLLQGGYGNKVDYGAAFKPWRVAAMLLVGLLAVLFMAKAADYYRLDQQFSELQAQFTETYRKFRPNDQRPITNPQVAVDTVRRDFGGNSTGEVFLPVMQTVAAALGQSDAVEVEAISFRAGVVDLRLTAPDVPTLESIRQRIAETGQYGATIQSTDQVGENVVSRIQVREAGV